MRRAEVLRIIGLNKQRGTGARTIISALLVLAAVFAYSALGVQSAEAAKYVGTVTVGAQGSALTYGTGGSAQYTVTVYRADRTGAFTAAMSVTSALPAGATASFSQPSVSFTESDS